MYKRALGPALILALVLVACAAPAPPARESAAPAAAPAAAPGPTAAARVAAKPAVAPLSPPVTVRIGTLLTLGDGPVFVAMDRGYFAEEGLEIELTRIDGAAQAMPHLATGQLDTAGITPSASFFNAVSRGVALRIAGDKGRSTTERSGGFWALREDVAASGAVRDWADLRGLTLGVNVPNTGTITDMQLDRSLALGGLTRDDVRVVELPYPDMNAAFGSRVIDAGMQTEPFLTLGEDLGVLRRWRSSTPPGSELYTTVWVYSPSFAETEAAYRFMAAQLRGVRDFNDAFVHGRGKAAVVESLTRHSAVKDARLYDRMAFNLVDPDGRVIPERVEEQLQYYLSAGFLQQSVDVAQVIDPRFTDYAVARLGPYQPPAP